MEQSEKVDRGIRGCQKGTGRGTEGAPKKDDLRAAGRPPSGTTPLQGSRHASRTLSSSFRRSKEQASKQKERPITCCCSRLRSRRPISKLQPQDFCVPRSRPQIPMLEGKKRYLMLAGPVSSCSSLARRRFVPVWDHGQGRGEMLVTHAHL